MLSEPLQDLAVIKKNEEFMINNINFEYITQQANFSYITEEQIQNAAAANSAPGGFPATVDNSCVVCVSHSCNG